MQRLRNFAIASVIALLVISSTASTQTKEPRESPPQTPPKKFIKHNPSIPNRYIVVLNDDVVSNDAPPEVRRERVTAIASRHAETYHGKFDYVYETALKGYAIQLPDEAAAIAISNLPEVRWVEEDAVATVGMPQQSESLCRGKLIPVSVLDIGGLKFSEPRRTSLLHGGISECSRLVIRNREEFNEFWNRLTASGSYKPPLPQVDFSRETIVVAAMGQKPSNGYEIIIVGACEVNNHVEVFVHSLEFGKCGPNLAVVTAPVDIVRLPRTDLPVVFREIENSCK